ncbi:MAG: peptidyl-alpha-hydroxyglycine alpha-amidating lyase family protein [Chloroflexota bacterium]
MPTFGSGDYRYTVVEGWEQLPAGWKHADVAGVATDAEDRVYVYTRNTARVLVYARDGTFLKSWGEGMFHDKPEGSAHGITIGPDGAVWCVDDGNHTIKQFSPDGDLLLTLGTEGVPSDTGYVGPQPGISGSTLLDSIQGGPPFNRPTNLAFSPNGDFYVSDGYGNCKVHRYSADGTLKQSWGEPGTGPGEFKLPHGIAVHPDGRVFVADRENDRIQIFSPDGAYLDQWLDVQRPTQLQIDADGIVFVAELWRRVGEVSQRLGRNEVDAPGRVSVLGPDGSVLSRWGGPNRCDPGMLCAPHSLALDSHGDLYVGEVTWTFGISRGGIPEDCHTIQKWERAR